MLDDIIQPKAVLVLGMHRSGTSATMAALEALGVYSGHADYANNENPKGFFENRNIVKFNDILLQYLGYSWSNPFVMEIQARVAELDPFFDEAVDLLRNSYGSSMLWGFKDPRVCILLPFWKHVLVEGQGCKVLHVHAVRNPMEVVASLGTRRERHAHFLCGDPDQSLLLWFAHYYQALKAIDNDENILVSFEDLLNDPLNQLERLSLFLGVQPSSNRIETYATTFLEKDLKHHTASSAHLRSEFPHFNFVADFYEKLLQLKELPNFGRQVIADLLSTLPEMDILRTCCKVAAPMFRDAEQVFTLQRTVERLESEIGDNVEVINDLGQLIVIKQQEIVALKQYVEEKLSKIEELKKQRSEEACRHEELQLESARISLLSSLQIFKKTAKLLQRIPGKVRCEQIVRRVANRVRLGRDARIIRNSSIFDSDYYLCMNPDVKAAGQDPFMHFLRHGVMQSRRPCPWFDPLYYQKTHLSSAGGINPLTHYILRGKNENLSTQQRLVDVEQSDAPKHFTTGQIVVFVGHDASPTGAPKVLLDLLQWILSHTGIELRLVLLEGGAWRERFEAIVPTLVLSDETSCSKAAKQVIVAEFIRSAKAVYLNTVVSAEFLHLIEDFELPVIAHIHEMRESIERYWPKQMAMLQERNIQYITVSPPVRDALISAYGVNAEKIHLIYPFIQLSKETVLIEQVEKRKIRQELGVPEDCFLIIGCGVIYHRKGVDLFLECAEKVLCHAETKPFFLWIGDGCSSIALPGMQRMAEELGISKHVFFTGQQENPLRYFLASDLFLLTSREDPYPLVCLEAASCGVPIICFADAGGIPEFVGDDAGVVVPYLDTGAMAEQVLRLMRETQLCRRLGEGARQKVIDRHIVDQAGREILLLLRDVASLKPAVSIIVSNYNHVQYLEERLESIYGQSFADIEVILLDDVSTDDSLVVLREYVKKFPRLTVLETNKKNSGSVWDLWQKGFTLARSDIVWMAESDGVCDPQFLQRLIPKLCDKEVVLAYCQSALMTETRDEAVPYVDIGYYDLLGRQRWMSDYVNGGVHEIHSYLAVYNIIPHVSSVVIRKSALQQDIFSSLRQYALSGDWVFYIRVLEGGKVAYLAQALNYHRIHEKSVITTNKNRNAALFQEFERVHVWLGERYALSRRIKEMMSRYMEHQVYPHCGRELAQSFGELYNWPKVAAASPCRYSEPQPVSEKTISEIKPIAFFLPQFQMVTESGRWRGDDSTQWTNTSLAEPIFDYHHQPRVPHADIGYYDLADWRTLKKQAEMARSFDVYGFCFYHYWFAGKRLQERPVDQFLQHPEIDISFCLCWDNENWTRRWDGQENDNFLAQHHSKDDDLLFISDLARYLQDSRYIRIEDKPLIIVYRPKLLPDALATSQRWRNWCRQNGIGEIFLVYMEVFANPDLPDDIGFDARVEFPPNKPGLRLTPVCPAGIDPSFSGNVYSYPAYVREILRARSLTDQDSGFFYTVMLGWDDTARRKNTGTVFADFSVQVFQELLRDTILRTCAEHAPHERFFFVNAWNEWAEGTYLEPDRIFGYTYLNAFAKEVWGNNLWQRAGTSARHQDAK